MIPLLRLKPISLLDQALNFRSTILQGENPALTTSKTIMEGKDTLNASKTTILLRAPGSTARAQSQRYTCNDSRDPQAGPLTGTRLRFW